jgi:DNA-binding NarL/FixJ family response regulator
VCDPQRLAAQALATALEGVSSRTAAVSCPTAAVRLVPTPRDAVLVLSLRGRTRFDDERELREALASLSGARVVCLTSPERVSLHLALKRAGASAVLHRGRPLEDVVAAVSGCSRTEPDRHPEDVDETLLRFLTPRERRTFDLMSVARSTREIAAEMGISHATARCYVQGVLQKLGAHSRAEAVVLAGRTPTTGIERCG